MFIRIYQVNTDRDKENVLFMGTEHLRRTGKKIANPAIYDKVFEGSVDADDLEKVYVIFNHQPEGYTGRSLSVSDVVEVVEKGESTFFFCDIIGFQKVLF